jgi:hypothetical protein
MQLRNHQNRRFTKQLFWEQYITLPETERTFHPPFTLHADKEGYINFGKAYIDSNDPSGYTVAQLLLNKDYEHWQHLCRCTWFKEAKEKWDAELDAKIYSEALAKIKELAKGDDAKALQAAKFLANKEYKHKGSKISRGRPSREEVAGELKREVEDQKFLVEAADRIRVIK